MLSDYYLLALQYSDLQIDYDTMQPLLSKQQCTAMRALAIISIMLHNICHNYPFAIKESDTEWAIDETMRWCDYILHPDINFVLNIFSCFGFIGVAAFVFLGGYGLVRKYEQADTPFATGSFIFMHYRKLLALVLVPQCAFVVLQLLLTHHTTVTAGGFLAQLTMTTNFLPMFVINPYIYWYLGMMMQLYVIYALLHRFNGPSARALIPMALIAAGFVLHIVVPCESHLGHLMRSNFFVGLLPFGLGMLAARFLHEKHLTTRCAALLLPVLLLMFIGFTFNYVLWGLNYGVGAAIFVCLARLLRGRLLNVAAAVGKVSALVFVLHPLTRFIVNFFAPNYLGGHYNTMVMIYVVFTALVVWCYRKLKIDTAVNNLIAPPPSKPSL